MMRRFKEMTAILAVVLLVSPAFSQQNEEEDRAAERILCYAASEGDMLSFLNLISTRPSINVNCACDEDGNTPLHYASLGGFHRIVGMLLKKGATIDSLSWRLAVSGDHLAVVKLFVEQGSSLCIFFKDKNYGYPASHYATTDEMRDFLLESEKKANIKTDSLGACYREEK